MSGIEADPAPIPDRVRRFLACSVSDRIADAARMLVEDPELAQSGYPAALVLGDLARVEAELGPHPQSAIRVDDATGWTALHLACASRFHLDPERAPGLAAVVRRLLDAGADPEASSAGARCWRPLECAVTSANSGPDNEPIIRLLLERGAAVRPETVVASLYPAGGTWCLRLLTGAASDVPERFTEALVEAAADGDVDAVTILLAAGADPDAPGPDGRSARWRALTAAASETAQLLGVPGDDPAERLLAAIVLGDGDEARRLASADPGLVGGLSGADRATLVNAAEHGKRAAVALMLELGFPVDARREGVDDDGATALHAAAWAGSPGIVALLLEHGADVDARDTRWESSPRQWAIVAGEQAPDGDPSPDRAATEALLRDAETTGS